MRRSHKPTASSRADPAPLAALVSTTWNPSDKSSGFALSGGNLTAVYSSFAVGGVRAAASATSGKYYWEVTATTATGTQFGMASGSWTLSNGLSSGAGIGTVGVDFSATSGGIFFDGTATGITIGAGSNGMVVCLAVDLTAKLFWARIGAGNWNGSAANNPATGTGGVSIVNLGGAIAAFPATTGQFSGSSVTANFGATGFAQAVPSGFQSGFGTSTGVDMATISATPPAGPTAGQLWWNSTTGQLMIWYDDGTSQQWVVTVNQVPGANIGSPSRPPRTTQLEAPDGAGLPR